MPHQRRCLKISTVHPFSALNAFFGGKLYRTLHFVRTVTTGFLATTSLGNVAILAAFPQPHLFSGICLGSLYNQNSRIGSLYKQNSRIGSIYEQNSRCNSNICKTITLITQDKKQPFCLRVYVYLLYHLTKLLNAISLFQKLSQLQVLGLYKGMASPMVGVAFVNSILFGVQRNVMRVLEPGLKSEIIAGSFAGAVQSIICCPVELAKLRVQIEGQGEKHQKFIPRKLRGRNQERYHGSIDCFFKIYKKHGLAGCYRGMTLTVMREVPSFAIYFGMFEICCQLFSPTGGHVDSLGAASLLLAGGMSGTASWVFTYPIDVIKSRYQADSTGLYNSMLDCTKKTYQAGGLRAFSQGLNATILRAFPMNAATFATVVMTLRLMKKEDQQVEYL